MKQLHILLADDDADDIFFFKKALKETDIPTRLTIAKDGDELMHFLENNAADLPDVVFLDLNMPRKTGNVCLAEIKGEQKFKHIPVVIYSTSLVPEVADVLYTVGAHYYLKKCDFPALPKAIHRVLSLLMDNPEKPPREKFIVNGKVIV